MHILELKKHFLHDKPVVILNIEGFYDGLQEQLQLMDRLGLLPRSLNEMLTFVTTAKEAIEVISEQWDRELED